MKLAAGLPEPEVPIVEEDFIAELEVVPAFKAADIGFDRSLIECLRPRRPGVRLCHLAALLALGTWQDRRLYAGGQGGDRLGRRQHEIRSLDTFVSDLCDAQRVPLKACYEKSFCLSTDDRGLPTPTPPRSNRSATAPG